MQKISVTSLMVEVTRRCNMSCDHCLRGEAERCDIKLEYITDLVNQVSYIGALTFSGGEPSLNIEAIDYTLKECKRLGVEVGSFYIATNGIDIHVDFVMACLRWYAYCEDKERCLVHVSNDYYHSHVSYNTELLDGLAFFGRKYTEEAHFYKGINQGNYAENFNDGREEYSSEILTEEDFEDATIYLNCKGQLVNGCDWSYENQEDNVICKVEDFTGWMDNLQEGVGR